MDAIILGGNKEDYWNSEGVQNKTLLRVGSRRIIDYVLSSVQNPAFNQVILCGDSSLPEEVISQADRFIFAEEIWDKITLAINSSSEEEFLILSSDIPLLNKKIVNFALSVYKQNYPVDILFFIIPKYAVENKFPNFKKTYFYVEGNHYKIGNLFFLNKKAFKNISTMVTPLIKSRKASHPFAYLKIAGFSLAIKYLINKITISEVEKRIKKITDLNCKVMPFMHPEIALDVDRFKDLLAIKNSWSKFVDN